MIKLHLLGFISVTTGDGHPVNGVLQQPKQLALLTYLAIALPFGLRRRDKLIALLWPELDTEHARSALRSALYRLRKALGPALVTRGTEEVGIDPALVWCDVVAFRSALGRGDFANALSLYRGDLLDGVFVSDAHDFEEWLELERAKLRKLAQQAQQNLPDYRPEPSAPEFPQLQPAPPSRRTRRLRQSAVALALVLFGWLVIARHTSTARWAEIEAQGGPPVGRTHMLGVFHPDMSSLVLFGGRSANDLLNDLWRLEAAPDGRTARWRRLTARNTPAPRWMAGGAVDHNGERIVMFGGALGHTSPCTNETWLLDDPFGAAPRWHLRHIEGRQPPPRAAHAVAYDETRDRLIAMGGNDCIQALYDDVWVLVNATNTDSAARWVQLHVDAGAVTPAPRRAHSAVYDARSNRLTVFGGAGPNTKMLNDVWVLTNANGLGGESQWIRVQTRGPVPEPRYHHTAVFDPALNRMTIYGGYNDDKRSQSDELWVLHGANGRAQWAEWKRLRTRGPSPGNRWIHVAGYDALQERMLLAGGRLKLSVPRGRLDAWMLSNATGE